MRWVLSIVVVLLTVSSLWAQPISETDVNLQGQFIDANKEKLLGNYDKSKTILQEIVKKDRSNHAAHFELARVLTRQDLDDQALKSIKKAVELDGENMWYQLFLADLHQKVGNDRLAAEVYANLVEEYPNKEAFYFKWAYYLVRARQIDEAIDVYAQLERKIGITEELVRRKHTLYVGTGDTKKAAKEIQRLIEAYPTKLQYRHLLADFYAQNDAVDKAKNIYRDILKIDATDPKAQLALNGNKSGASSKLRNIFEQETVHIDLKIQELVPYIQKVADGDQSVATEGLELSEILIQVHPQEAKAFAAYGDLLYYTGKINEARKAYERTLELDESVYAVWEQLLYIHLEQKSYDQLEKTSEEALDIFPNQARVYYMNGLAKHEKNKYAQAIDMLEEAQLMAGRDGHLRYDLYLQLGKSYHAKDNGASSNQAFEAALKLNPQAYPALDAYSYALAERGEDLARAQELIERANTLVPNHPEIEHTYAWVYYKQEDYKTAQKWLEKTLKKSHPNQALVIEHYGDVLFRLNQVDEALLQWQKARALGSDSELLDKKITERRLYE